MKKSIKKSFVPSLLVAGLELVLASQLPAQTFKTLHNFNGNDGGNTSSGLILFSNTLYGTTLSTVFALNTDGTGFRTLHTLNGGTDGGGVGGLVLSGNTLYGPAITAGSGGFGTVFSVNTDGTGFTNLYSFSDWDGASPGPDLVLTGSTLYGVTPIGGSGSGTVFAINTDGSDFLNLYNFSGGSDGNAPRGVAFSSNTLFGVASIGGTLGSETPLGSGTVFAINTDGSGFANLYSFTPASTNSSGVYTNSDGWEPQAGLVMSGGSCYGVTGAGGEFGSGTIFGLQADGSGFTNLYNFPELPSSAPKTNKGGAQPRATLIISGRTLYGTTSLGGDYGNGTIFAINTDGTGFTTLYSFRSASNNFRRSSLVLSGNTLYGTTWGPKSGYGTVFRMSFEPQLSIAPSGPDLILTWPTNYAGFDYTSYHLQSTTNLGSSAVWATNLPAPVIVNGEFTVTNSISGAQQFFRLSQ
jgi:uncharacterized repeat protein (TIGR03803 family)